MAFDSPGNISHKDLARLANVTQSTVSRALDPLRCHLISPPVRRRITDLARDLGYQPNIHARRTRSRCSETITLVIDDIVAGGRPFYDFNRLNTLVTFEQVNGIIDGANEYDFDVKFLPLSFRREADAKLLSRRLGFPYSDGVLFLGFHYLRRLLPIINASQQPVAVAMAETDLYACFNVDPAPGYRQLIAELRRRGRRQIAFCGIDNRNLPFQVFRHQALRQALAEESGGEIAEVAEIYVNNLLDIRRQAEKLCVAKSGIDTLVCSSDSLALHLRNELLYLGAEKRFAVVGYAAEPQLDDLASIIVPRYDICRQAACSLANAIRGKTPLQPATELVPSSLRPGASL
ncbi:MAG: LacI family DNA-binding transcriptional regulator [Lentisphaeria bacterium]|nr:LacI family DNA-binding transcriptional regulator [Lentisphaeria bacterium]